MFPVTSKCGRNFWLFAKSVKNTRTTERALKLECFKALFFIMRLFFGADTLRVADVTARLFPVSPAFATFDAAAETYGKGEEE